MFFKCGHSARGDNAMSYNAGRKNGPDPSIRCRTCYNELRKVYQRRRKAEAKARTTQTGTIVKHG